MWIQRNRFLLFGLALLCVLCSNAQDRKYKELFPVGLKLSPSALHLGFGATRMWGPVGGVSEFSSDTFDSTYTSTNYGMGGIGLYLEGGYSRYFKSNPVADNIDVTLAFKQYRGEQQHEGTLVWRRANDEIDTLLVDGWGYFDQTAISLSFNANQHLQLTDKKYYTFGYGLDVNYRIFENSFHSADFGLQQNNIPKRVMANLHLRFGYGFYWKSRLLVNPSLEIPVIGTGGIGSIRYYRIGYVPTILSIRLTWLKRPKSFDCPAIKPNRGEKVKKKDYLQELFHPDKERNPIPKSDGDSY